MNREHQKKLADERSTFVEAAPRDGMHSAGDGRASQPLKDRPRHTNIVYAGLGRVTVPWGLV